MKNKENTKNPFKLFGSYIGLLLGVIGSYFSFAIVFDLAEKGSFNLFALFIPLIPLLVGFLLGYGIHVLVIKIKNK